MAISVRTLEPGEGPALPSGLVTGKDSKSRIAAVLISTDDSLWPQIGKFIPSRFTLKQVDSVEQLLGDIEPGAAAVLIWDARAESEVISRLSVLQQHSPRLAVLVLDVAAKSADWQPLVRQNQIVGMIGSPIAEGEFVRLLNQAGEEVQARAALLGTSATSAARAAAAESPPARKLPLLWIGMALMLVAAVVAFIALRDRPAPAPAALPTASKAVPEAPAPARDSRNDQIETLLENAGQAMLERRYVAPADNSALYFYRRVLTFDADNGEALQGLDRLAELLTVRAQSAVDQHQYDQALQSLEIARSLKPDDARVQSLDQRLAGLRSELGASQIQAALAAQNFDRAGVLIDEALRARTISAVQASQLREALKSQRTDSDISRFQRLAQARLQQDRLLEPASDSASYYLERARRAGAVPAALTVETRQLQQKLADAARAAIEQRRFGDAEKLIAAVRGEGAAPTAVASLQEALRAARNPARPDPQEVAESAAKAKADAEVARKQAEASAAPAEVPLKLLKPLRPEYPREAALRGTEGWVDLSFLVTADGKPVNVRVVDAAPRGVFDKAAVVAVQAARYQPWSATDATVARQANLRVSFRLAK